MFENDLNTNNSIKYNWAKGIKECLESYGFHRAWTDGVGNEAAFLNSFKRKMIIASNKIGVLSYLAAIDFQLTKSLRMRIN